MPIAAVPVALVDDDPPVRRALARLLASAGFAVTTFDSAEAFLDGVAEASPACVVLDVHLPRMSGLDLARLLRSVGSPAPVILLTADHELARSERVAQSGTPCLTKPCDGQTLIDSIRHVLSAPLTAAR